MRNIYGQFDLYGAAKRSKGIAGLFAQGQAGFASDMGTALMNRLFQDPAGTIPAAAPGDPVGLIKRFAGTVDAAQATQANKPTLVRWPKGGRRALAPSNILTGWSGTTSGQRTPINPPAFAKGPDAVTFIAAAGGGAGSRISSNLTAAAVAGQTRITFSSLVRPRATFPAGANMGAGIEIGATGLGFHAVLVTDDGRITQYSSTNQAAVLSWDCVPVGDGWYDMSLTVNLVGATIASVLQLQYSYRGISAGASDIVVADISSPQTEFGNRSAYQTVYSQYDIVEGGVRYNLCSYTDNLGVNSWGKTAMTVSDFTTLTETAVMGQHAVTSTNLNNQVQVIAGIRYKLSMRLKYIAAGVRYATIYFGGAGFGSTALQSISVDLQMQTILNIVGDATAVIIPVAGDPTSFDIIMRKAAITTGATTALAIYFNLNPSTGTNPYMGDPSRKVGVSQLQLTVDNELPYQPIQNGWEDLGGVPSVWHLFNEGGGKSMGFSSVLPADIYGMATVNELGAVSIEQSASGPINVLRRERQADCVFRRGAFNASEQADIRSSWRKYAA